jgi:hypothetical protein
MDAIEEGHPNYEEVQLLSGAPLDTLALDIFDASAVGRFALASDGRAILKQRVSLHLSLLTSDISGIRNGGNAVEHRFM